MKINPFGPLNNNPYRKQIEQQEIKRETVKKRDQLEISSEAKEMLSQEKVTKAREEKVEALKQQVQSGNYKVDPKAVANKFYEFWSE